MPPRIDHELCTGCGLCDLRCPGDLIHLDESSGLPEVKYPEECWHCGVCRAECPTGAVEIVFPALWTMGS